MTEQWNGREGDSIDCQKLGDIAGWYLAAKALRPWPLRYGPTRCSSLAMRSPQRQKQVVSPAEPQPWFETDHLNRPEGRKAILRFFCRSHVCKQPAHRGQRDSLLRWQAHPYHQAIAPTLP